MSKWLDTRGNKPIAIRVCARCGIKHAYTDLHEDPNYPGIFVCRDDLDVLDPWRLPARETENISLDQPRPDRTLAPGAYAASYPQEQAVLGDNGGFSMVGTQGGQPFGIAGQITTLQQPKPWAPNAQVALGAQIAVQVGLGGIGEYAIGEFAIGEPAGTPNGNPVGMNAVGQDFVVFTCIIPGMTGANPPLWTAATSTLVVDNSVLWQNAGIYLP